jgi:hypothetical protein
LRRVPGDVSATSRLLPRLCDIAVGEQALDPGFDLGGGQSEGFEEVLLGQAADIHLQEVAQVAHIAVQVDDPFGHFVGPPM